MPPTRALVFGCVLTFAAPASAAPVPTWSDPTHGALVGAAERARKAEATALDAARGELARAEREVARHEATITRERERAASAERRLPTVSRALDEARAASASASAALRRAIDAERKAGDAERAQAAEARRAAEVTRDERRKALEVAKQTANGAKWELASATKRGEAAQAKLVTARDLAAAQARRVALAEARATSAAAWVEATRALAERRGEEAVSALARVDEAMVGPADRAWVSCLGPSELTPEREAACTTAAVARPSARRHLGLVMIGAGRLDEALALLSAGPVAADDAEVRAAAGLALLRAGRPADATGHLERAVKLVDDVDVLDALAQAYAATGRPADALVTLERVARLDPAREGVAFRQASLADALGRREEARAHLRRYLADTGAAPEMTDPQYAACRKDLYREVVAGAELALGAVPDKARGHLYLGLAAARDGDLARAEPHFARALELAPDDLEVRWQIGAHLLQRGETARAVGHLERVAEGRHGGAAARVALGVALSRLGRGPEAVATLEPIAGADPTARAALGVAHARRGDRTRARAELEEASRGAADPGLRAIVEHDLAALAYEDGRRDDALAGMADTATTPEGHALRGLVALEAGDVSAAEAHLTRAIAAQPGYLQARLALGRALLAGGRAEAAVQALRRAVALDPACPDAHVQLGAALDRAGDGAGAASEFRKADELRAHERRRAAAAGDAPMGPGGTGGPGAEAGTMPGDKITVRRIAVAELGAVEPDPQWAWLGLGIAEALSTDLAQLSRLDVVERGQVAALMREIKFSSLGVVDAATAPRIGQVLGVEALVVGSYQVTEGRIRIDGRLVDLTTRSVIRAGTVDGPLDDLFALQRALALDLVGSWAAVGSAERAAVSAAPGGSVDGLRQLALTRRKMLDGDQVGARAAYREAAKSSPELARRVKDLHAAYQDAEARVAILPFKNTTGAPESEWIGSGLAESLATDMRRIGLYVVERGEIAKVMTEQKFGAIVDPTRAARVGLQVGAQVILLGSYQTVGDLLAIDARMVQVETGAVLLTERVSGRGDELFALERELTARIARALDVQVSAEELAALAGDAPDLEDFKASILKDRLFVLKQPTPAVTDDGSEVGPVIAGLAAVALGVTGGLLYGAGEARVEAAEREQALYRRSVDADEMARRYTRAADASDEAEALRAGAFVALGLAAVAAIYTTWALLDDDDAPRGEGAVIPSARVAPSFTPGGVGVGVEVGF